MTDSKIRTSADNLRNLLKMVEQDLSDSDRVKDKVDEFFSQSDGLFRFHDLNSRTQLLGRVEWEVETIIRDSKIPSAVFLEKQASQLFECLCLKVKQNQTSMVYNNLKEHIANTLRALDVFETEVKTPFDYEFTAEDIAEIKKEVTKYLEDVQYLREVVVSVPDKIDGLFSVSGEYEVFVHQNEHYDNHIDDLIKQNLLTEDEVLSYLYENNYDIEWYGDNINENEIRQKIYNQLESTLSILKPIEIERFVNGMELEIPIDMKPVAKRIISDIEDYCRRIDDQLTIEHIRGSEDLRELIIDKGDYLLFSKEYADREFFEYVPYSWIADGIDNRKDIGVAKDIFEKISNDPDYSGESDSQKMIYSYVEDNMDTIVEMIKQDKELVSEIIPEEHLFEASGLWVFYTYI